MGPRKVKNEGSGKRSGAKVKGKPRAAPKRGGRGVRRGRKREKGGEVDGFKWLNKLAATTVGATPEGVTAVANAEAVPVNEWLAAPYARSAQLPPPKPEPSVSDHYKFQEEEEKYSVSDESEECNCSNSKYPVKKTSILKRDPSSSNSIVTNYIKSGMDQVASFIVESAIRFGEQHGVVVPDKNTPNVYQITTPEKKFEEKFRKIRFKIPERSVVYQESRKPHWKTQYKNRKGLGRRAQTPMPDRALTQPCASSSWDSTPDSLEEILPILEKLKNDGGIVTSELDLNKLGSVSEEDVRVRARGRLREKNRRREEVRARDAGARKNLRGRITRFRSLDAESDKGSEESDYPGPEDPGWKKMRRDSLDLGRRRIRGGAKSQDSAPPY